MGIKAGERRNLEMDKNLDGDCDLGVPGREIATGDVHVHFLVRCTTNVW